MHACVSLLGKQLCHFEEFYPIWQVRAYQCMVPHHAIAGYTPSLIKPFNTLTDKAVYRWHETFISDVTSGNALGT